MSELKVNTISEVTGANGVVVDSVKLKDGGIVIADAGNIGSASDTDAIAIASGGGVTFSQAATFSSTIGSGAITSTGIVTGTAFTAGSAVLAEAELELLDGLTAGTAIASKVVTTDANIDTTGQRNLTISGELDAATLDISGAIDIAGASVLHGLLTQDGGAVFNEGSADVDFRVESNGKTHALFVDGGNDKVGINIVAGVPDAVLHIQSDGAGQAPNAAADELCLEGSANVGMSILSGNDSAGRIYFGDNGDDDIGQIRYNHDDNSMNFKVNALADAMKIDSIGAVTKPLQPAFLCMQTTSINAETVNDATVTTVGLNAEIFDVNADFANSVFTAPVTGKYQFSGKVGIDTGSSSNTRFDQIVAQIATSNRIYYFDASGTVYTDSNDKGWSNGSMLADMDANDTATLRIYVKRNGGTGTTEIARSGDTAGLSTYMSGYLVA